MNRTLYFNPRTDNINKHVDASSGTVFLDPIKATWTGLVFIFGTVGALLNFTISGFILFIVFTLVTLCLGHSLGMHRRFIHRSYDCPKVLEYFFVHLGVLVGLAGPIGMLKTHDLRDWAQREKQCHPYFAHGKKWFHDAYWQLFCSIKLDDPPKVQIESGIANDLVYKWMEKTWMLQSLPWAILFYLIGGWSWVFLGVFSRMTVSILGHWLIGFFAHNSGSRSWHVKGAAVQGFNISCAALLTMGESWHNNHHAFPKSAKFGLKTGEIDIGWFVLKLLEKGNLVSNLVLPSDLEQRKELVSLIPNKNHL